MQINRVGINYCNPSFEANYFGIKRNGKDYKFKEISTDNEEKLGKNPVLIVYKTYSKKYIDDYSSITGHMPLSTIEIPMVQRGRYYTADIDFDLSTTNIKYRISYKDSGKYERNGEMQILDYLKYLNIASMEDRLSNGLPLEQAISKGTATGLIVTNLTQIPKDVPIILILDRVYDEYNVLPQLPNNVIGIVVSNGNIKGLSHTANFIRNHLSAASIIWDKNKFNRLKEQAGKYLTIDNGNGILKYKETTPVPLKAETITKVEVPKLENVENLLNFDELTPQNCGNKGYRLSIMQKLVKEGVLRDITIPDGFVIPAGYIKKYQKDIQDVTDNLRADVSYIGGNLRENNRYDQEVVNKLKELGLPTNNNSRIIVRSNFNTEDLGSFSSAGIYSSSIPDEGSIIYCTSKIIDESLMENKITKYVHKKYGIEDNQIQPSVIVQERIPGIDYSFTVYSDDGNNNILIELLDTKLGYVNPGSSIIKYNKNTKELTLERSISPRAKYVLDEKGNIVEKDYGEDRIKNAWNTLAPLLGIVTAGALTLEKFFKHAQDIEGGIKNGKVYFWQTRDIVAKAVKRI